jgi:ribonucleoside-triphosphate reductase
MEEHNEEKKQDNVKVPCEVYSRVVGYLRPVQAWNEGKQAEFADRKQFVIPETAQE